MKQIDKQVDELNGIIHRRNLYANGRRYINAHGIDGVLHVQDLYTEKSIAVATLGKLFDGYGQEVILDKPIVKLRLRRKASTGEWLVKVWINGVYSEDKTYYTDEKADAISTMSTMAQGFTSQGLAII